MIKSILQNIPEAKQLLEMEIEELAGYVLEHLHAAGGNTLSQGNSLPNNLANSISSSYLSNKDKIYKAIVTACHWLIKNDYLQVINEQGFYEISKKGNEIKTADEFNARLSQSTVANVIAPLASPKPASQFTKKTSYSLPRLSLSESESVWLREVYECFKNGEKVDIKALKVKLRGQIPTDFEPKMIDGRLLLHGRHITLYGIWHVDHDTQLLDEADQVIRAIGSLIYTNTKRETIISSEVADLTGLAQSKVEFLIKEIRLFGFFWSDVAMASEDGYFQVEVNDERVFDEYYQYEGIEKVFVNLNARREALTNPENNPDDKRKVFVVHGRNLEARTSLFQFLRSIGLKPLEWSQAIKETGKGSPFIGEILDVAFSKAQAVVILLTPDDEARLREPFWGVSEPTHETELTGQARPNVLFEAGMAMGRNPNRTVIVELGNLRPFSDIAGRHTIRLSNKVAARQELAQRLGTAGCPVDLTGLDWHTDGDFNIESSRYESVSVVLPKQERAPQLTHEEESIKAEYFNHLTGREKEVLRSYIDAKTRTQRLRYDEGAVVELINADVLYYASNRAVSIWTPGDYYTEVNMNLWAWKYLNQHPELIVDDEA